ncbi:MAG: hypothetical protein DMD36_18725 [Gemmatimonadetes bacterium]|nr:MAG: hypothetical protein DMD36_18725 [Gemmatimonadota bacterium]
MKKGITGVFGLAVLVFGASLVGSPALAKCGKDCKKPIAAEFKACKGACAKGTPGKACKKECKDENKAEKKACKAATNPTPPTCGFTDEE